MMHPIIQNTRAFKILLRAPWNVFMSQINCFNWICEQIKISELAETRLTLPFQYGTHKYCTVYM